MTLMLASGLYYAASFILIISVIVFIHELGHFLMARRFGVHVEQFSIGFGKEIIGWEDRHGTRWKISLIPMGGFIKMMGDADASSRTDHDALEQMSEADKTIDKVNDV